MMPSGQDRLPHPGCSWSLNGRPITSPDQQTPIILCLDSRHRLRFQAALGRAAILASCPLRVLEALDRNPQRIVILTRSEPSRPCCRDMLEEVRARVGGSDGRPHGGARNRPAAGKPRRHLPVRIRLRRLSHHVNAAARSGARLPAVATRFGVGARQLTELFRRSGQQSPMRQVRRNRMLRAWRLLTSTKESVARIARLMSYSEVANFRRAFRREFGLSPAQARILKPKQPKTPEITP